MGKKETYLARGKEEYRFTRYDTGICRIEKQRNLGTLGTFKDYNIQVTPEEGNQMYQDLKTAGFERKDSLEF